MAKMDDSDLLKHLQANEEDSAEYIDLIGATRLKAMREYYREPYPGDEELDGWSTIVTSEVSDAVEAMLPGLVDTFTSSDEAVVFEPTKPEDVEGAAQATDACNYVFYKQNNGFLVLYTAIKDALIAQNCAVEWRLVSETVRDVQEVQGAPLEALAMLESQGFEIEAATPVQQPPMADAMGMPIEAPPLFNARVSKKVEKKRIRIEAFPPEQLHIKRGWTTPLLDECPYVARAMEVTLSDLRQMGFKNVTAEDLRASDDPSPVGSDEDYRRSRAGESTRAEDDTVDIEDESLATGWLRIEYVLVDYDGDGIAERRLIHRLESKILSNEETDHVQIATASPIINPHRWDGMSVAEIASDGQLLKTDLTRGMVNASNLAVNPRKTVLTDAQGAPYANIDDLMDFRIGGLVRQSRPDSIGMEPTPFNAANTLPVLGYVDSMLEKRIGYSSNQAGMDGDSLKPGRTATEVSIQSNASQQRVKLIARIFAEVLVTPIFRGILKLLTSGEMEPLAFRLRGKFVQYDPNEWRDGYDMTINVGLGTGDKAQQISFFNGLLERQMGLAQSPFGSLMITPDNIYNTLAKLVELGGQKNVGDFIGDPQGKSLPPPGPNPQLQIEQMKLQASQAGEQAKMQVQAQTKQMEMQYQMQADEMQRQLQAQLEMIRQQAQQQTDANRQGMEAQMHSMKLEQEAQLAALKEQYAERERERQMGFQRWKAELDASVRIETANISSKNKLSNPATMAATAEIGREVQP
ncbi:MULTISPECIES: hypothetical protein [unclassified Simplicispira]|uniref:portal protein n=1 Tax=unclassified Simplicispira TaxID=2630407 RepID=UPI000D5D3D1F|nr:MULTISPECIES: hypothetical protein [unclassified Simplicispira]PVY56744.1 hypothetical protein C8D04_2008 [Simplicispira sp. 125]REG17688.1 hypothetical protein C8D01_2318 [Simplicispira sp. 110]